MAGTIKTPEIMKATRILETILLLCICAHAHAQATDYVIDEVKDRKAFESAEWNWHSIGKDIQAGYAQFKIFGSTQSISVVRYKASSHKTDFLHCPGEQRSITSKAGEKHKALAALNGSYFNVKTLYPTTYFKDGGTQVGWTDSKELPRTNGLVCLKGKKIEVVEAADTNEFYTIAKRYKECLASGPVLVDDGVRRSYDYAKSFFTYRHPRTMIGITRDGWIYLVVVDGRFKGKGEGATIAEMAFLAEQFGLYDALNLDGGGSSTVWNSVDGTMNHPYDNKKFDHQGEREVPNVVLVY